MKNSWLIGSVITIGVILLLMGLLYGFNILAAVGFVMAVIGIAMLGGQKGWWSGLGTQGEPDGLQERDTRTLQGRDAQTLKIAAMVLGILGSVVTFFVSVGAVVLGGLFSAITGEGFAYLVGWLVVLSSIAALVGAILTHSNPRVGAILLGIAAIPSILFTILVSSLFFGLGTLLLVIAAVLAFMPARRRKVKPRRPLVSGVVEEDGSI